MTDLAAYDMNSEMKFMNKQIQKVLDNILLSPWAAIPEKETDGPGTV